MAWGSIPLYRHLGPLGLFGFKSFLGLRQPMVLGVALRVQRTQQSGTLVTDSNNLAEYSGESILGYLDP